MEKSKEKYYGPNKRGIPKLRAAFDSVKSIDEKLKIFRKIEARLPENKLGADCWRMAAHLSNHDQDPLKILDFGKRALNITLKNEDNASLAIGCDDSSAVISGILHVLGSASRKLKRYNESLSYLNWSDRNLTKLLEDNSGNKSLNLELLRNTQSELFWVKRAMGKGEDAVLHMKKVLEIEEKIKKKGCVELGKANKDVSDAYLEVNNYKEALPFALKALEIYKKHTDTGDDSEEMILKLRMCLVSIFTVLGEHDKALEHNRLCLSGFKGIDKYSLLLLESEAEGGLILVALGKYEEAIEILKPVISHSENAGNHRARAIACMSIAKAFCRLEKYADARKYIKMTVRILEKKGLGAGFIATGFMNMSELFGEMEEYEMAISLIQRSLDIPELPQKLFANCSLRLFSLVSLSAMENMGISFLVEVVERLKEKFGPNHYDVGNAYAKLGKVYIKSGRPEMAAGCFVSARDIFVVSCGPHNLASLAASQTLSVVYASMKRYDLSNEIQQQVVDGFKGMGISEQAKVDKAVEKLTMMVRRDIGEDISSEDGEEEDLSATDSECGVSDDENVT